MKKTLSIILAALMIVSCIPIFASAETITLSRSNIEIIPPTVSPAEVNYGEGIANVVVTGGQLWYVDENGNKTEVKGYFDIRNKATVNPINTGEYKPTLLFYPEDTETYGTVSSSLSYLRMTIVSGEWPVIYIRGAYTKIVTPPSFSCDAGDNLAIYTSYTKTGGKTVDANGKNVTSSGQFYIDEANSGGKNQYLYEDTYVTARWDGKSQTGYESSYYENVLVKVTRKTAYLSTAPSIPAVLVGTTYGDALAQLKASVLLSGSKSSYDNSNKFWVPTYPEGVTAETPLTEDTTITVTYQNPATDDTFTAEVAIDVYTKPLAVISEAPTIDATDIKPGMKASVLTLTGGKAVKEGTETEVAGTFSIKNPDALLTAGYNTIDVAFTPDDTDSYDGTETVVRVNIASLITTLPTLDATGVEDGMTASALTLTGGEATEEGTFSIADPDQVLAIGTNRITVKFTPSAEGAEYFETKVISVVIQGEYKFLDKDGNETVPVYTITYGTPIKDANLNIPTVLLQTGCTLNASSNYSYTAPAGKDAIFTNSFSGLTLPVGEHTFDVLVRPSGYSIYVTPPYIATTLQVIIKVIPVEMNVRSVYYSDLSGKLSVTIDNLGAKGTLDIYVEDVLVGDDVATTTYGTNTYRTAEITTWAPEVSYNKDYKVKVVYNPIENDPISMKDYESTFRTNLMMTVKKEGIFTLEVNDNQISGNSYDLVGEGYRISCSVPYEYQSDFISWYIVDDNGDPIDVEVYGIEKKYEVSAGTLVESKVEAELTDYIIHFDMPNCNVKVYYKTQAMLDAEIRQEAIDNCDCICHHNNPVSQFIWKIISFFMDLFGITKDCSCGYPHGAK